MQLKRNLEAALVFFILQSVLGLPCGFSKGRSLSFEDVMKFRKIEDSVISPDGSWIAFAAVPDRGNGEVVVRATEGEQTLTLIHGAKPVFSKDSHWLAVTLEPDLFKVEKAEREKSQKPKQGLALLDISKGEWFSVEAVQKYLFSEDSRWLAYLHFPPEKNTGSRNGEGGEKEQNRKGSQQEETETDKEENRWAALILRDLETGAEIEIADVSSFTFDPRSRFLIAVVRHPQKSEEQVVSRRLEGGAGDLAIEILATEPRLGELTWSKEGEHLAFLGADTEKGSARLWVWDGDGSESSRVGPSPSGWMTPFKNGLVWSEDQKRLFVGLKRPGIEVKQDQEEKAGEPVEENGLDRDALLARREVDVWHWNDPRIVPHQKKAWEKLQEHTFAGLYRTEKPGQIVPLADEAVPDVSPSQNRFVALGESDIPYLKEITWEGRFHDSYLVDLNDGSRKKVASRISTEAKLSPGGRFVAYYQERNWQIYDRETDQLRNLTEDLGVPFSNEDHDYPSEVPGYGMAGWVEGDRALLIYDKFDLWQFPTDGGDPISVTDGEGRRRKIEFRVVKTDPEQRFFAKTEPLLLRSFSEKSKSFGFYSAAVGTPGVSVLLEGEKRFDFLKKAKDAGRLIFTRQSYDEFPDIWVTDSSFHAPRRLTKVNPQLEEFAWGEAELVEWLSLDGIPLQGVLIKPGNFDPDRRYPVLVYFYRFFSQRLHEFNQPVINHRPCFPLYASHGYALFLPDIRFEVGQPGFSATKCLVPGVQKLIDMGVADADAVGLHGHSWSGYQTAFVITQTDIFAAAIAGAPVSNMTSAYGGIRWSTGLARQFQYEKTQSRIGGSLWEYPERYIENSPLFFADRINTPLLIMFGDDDGAVPWYQGIELYLAMRRLGKDSIFLEYRGEPHHLKKYPNKLDYAIRMKQYLDHYLKGAEAPRWISKGEPYNGK